jgi:hypothetical protein
VLYDPEFWNPLRSCGERASSSVSRESARLVE